jgi:2-hydroxy-3-oxopropionate reductase
MAANLIKAGYRLKVWNRSPEKTAGLADLGAEPVAEPGEAARGAQVLFTMVSDGAAVAEVLFDRGAAAALEPGALVIDCSSIAPAEARGHAARLAEGGVAQLDAPVSGGPSGAEAATLAIMVGGTPEDFERGRPLLACLGRPVHVGPIGAGQLAKLANQLIVALAIGAVAEGLLLAAVGGADAARVREAMLGGFADSLILQIHGERMVERRFLPGGAAKLHLKDLRNAAATAEAAGLALPLTEKVRDLYERLIAHGGGDYDHSAVLLEIERLSAGARLGAGDDVLPG